MSCKTRCHKCTTMHCQALQHTATHCNTRQHTATHGNKAQGESRQVVRHVVTNALQHTVVQCNTLQHTQHTPKHEQATSHVSQIMAYTHCNTLQHTATHCNTLQHTATRCNARTSHVTCLSSHGTYTLQHTAGRKWTSCPTYCHKCTATHCNTLHHTAGRK